MGYTTKFDGHFNLHKPLNVLQYNELIELTEKNAGVVRGAPDSWCQWIPTRDGMGIEWDGREKFYEYVPWLKFLIERYFQPWGLVLNGEVLYQGENITDRGSIIIRNNVITVQKYERNPDIPICDVCEMSYDIREPHVH